MIAFLGYLGVIGFSVAGGFLPCLVMSIRDGAV